MAFQELKQRQSTMWDSGPFERIAEQIADVHDESLADTLPAERREELHRSFVDLMERYRTPTGLSSRSEHIRAKGKTHEQG